MSIITGSATYERLLDEAADLLSEDGENPEYDRAIVELVTRMLGLSHGRHEGVHQMLRLIQDTRR